MTSIVINCRHGGFGLSSKAWEMFRELKENPPKYDFEINRSDPILVKVVEELGDDASGKHSRLKIVDIPDDVEWEIGEYGGREWVAEKHRRWF